MTKSDLKFKVWLQDAPDGVVEFLTTAPWPEMGGEAEEEKPLDADLPAEEKTKKVKKSQSENPMKNFSAFFAFHFLPQYVFLLLDLDNEETANLGLNLNFEISVQFSFLSPQS